MFKRHRAMVLILAPLGVFLMSFVGLTACIKDVLDEVPNKSASSESKCVYGNSCTTVGEFCVEPKTGYTLACDQVTLKYGSACKVGYFCDKTLTSGQFPGCINRDNPTKPVTLVCDPSKNKLSDPLMSSGGPDAMADTTSSSDTTSLSDVGGADATPDAGPSDVSPADAVPDTSVTDTGTAGAGDSTVADTASAADTALADSVASADASGDVVTDAGTCGSGAPPVPCKAAAYGCLYPGVTFCYSSDPIPVKMECCANPSDTTGKGSWAPEGKCGDSSIPFCWKSGTDAGETGGTDAPASDTGLADAGPTDTGPADTGPSDTSVADSGAADSGAADSGASDTGSADASLADTGPTDTGPDTIVTDAGPAETGPADTGVADTGVSDTGAADTGLADAGAADAPSSDGGPETIADTSSDVLIIPSCATAPAGRITAIFTSPVPRPATLAGTMGFKMWTQYPPATLPDVEWDKKPRCLAPSSSASLMSCDLGPTVSGAKLYFIVGNVKVVTDAEFSTWYMNRDDTTGVRTMTGSLTMCNGTTTIYGPSSTLSTAGSVRWSDEVDPITGLFRANVLVTHP